MEEEADVKMEVEMEVEADNVYFFKKKIMISLNFKGIMSYYYFNFFL